MRLGKTKIYSKIYSKIFTMVLFVFTISFHAFANPNQVGIVLGTIAGISLKKDLANDRAIDGAISYTLRDDRTLVLHANYLFENQFAFDVQLPKPFMLYYGLGARLSILDEGPNDDELAFGPRVPVGLTYDFDNPNLEFFTEIALNFDFIPDTDADLDFGIGGRIKF